MSLLNYVLVCQLSTTCQNAKTDVFDVVIMKALIKHNGLTLTELAFIRVDQMSLIQSLNVTGSCNNMLVFMRARPFCS